MFCNKLTIAALAAGAFAFSSANALSAKTFSNIQVSERCKTLFTTMLGDEQLNSCLPVASIAPFLSTRTVSDPESLKSIFTQLCSTQACDQSFIDGYADQVASECATDLQALKSPAKIISSVLRMYTPLHKAACYVDEDRQFCLVKNILSLNIDISEGVPSPYEVFNMAQNVEVCTKCNQHMVGTFMEYLTGNNVPSFPISKDQEAKVVDVMREKCGSEFADGIATATEAPFPRAQAELLMSAAGTVSINALAVFVVAGVTLGANF